MIKIENELTIYWIPPLRDNELGWININTISWNIIDWHSFDDFGQTLDTLTIKHPFTNQVMEVYSNDEGETFTTEADLINLT